MIFHFCTTATFKSMVKNVKWFQLVAFIAANYPNSKWNESVM